MSFVEIIVLSHNKSHLSLQFLESLYRHTSISDFHLVWLDSGSSDNTSEVLFEYAKNHNNMSYAIARQNLGVIAGRNLAYNIASIESECDWILFLDNDQIPLCNWLSAYKPLMNNFDIIGIEAWQMNNDFFPIRKISHGRENFSYVGCGGMMIKRTIIDDIGLFDVRFNPAYFEDPDFCFRAHDAGYRIGWVAKSPVLHLSHATLGTMKSNFKISYGKFKQKWYGKKPPVLNLN